MVNINAYYAIEVRTEMDKYGNEEYKIEKIASIGLNMLIDELIEKGRVTDYIPLRQRGGNYFGILKYKSKGRKQCELRFEQVTHITGIGVLRSSAPNKGNMLFRQIAPGYIEIYIVNSGGRSAQLTASDRDELENQKIITRFHSQIRTNFVLMTDSELTQYLAGNDLSEAKGNKIFKQI